MRDVILLIVVLGILPFAFMKPYIGLLAWSWLGYMNPHRLTWGFAFDFPFVQMVALVTLLGLLFSREKKSFPWTPLTVVWLLFIIWTCITTFFALHQQDAIQELERFSKIQLMIITTYLLINSRHRIQLLVWTIVVSIGFFGVKGGLFTLATGGNYMVWGPIGSFIEGNNEIALALLIIIPLMRYLQLTTENRWVKHGLTAAMVLCGFAVLGSYSRGAFLGIAAIIFFLWLKSKRKIVIAIPIILVSLTLWSFMPEKYADRISTINQYEEDGSAMGRINAWWFAYNLAKDRPVIGGGFDAFSPDLFYKYAPIAEDFHDAHSIYFEVLGEQGFVGLALFLTMGTLMFLTGNWIIRHTRSHKDLAWAEHLAAMLQVSFIGYAVGGTFLGLAYFDLPYHLMAIMVITKVLIQKQLNPESSLPVRRGMPIPRQAQTLARHDRAR